MLRINSIFRFENILRRQLFSRLIYTSACNNFKVAVIGAAGGIGQPLCLLLMQNPLVTRLALYDLAPKTAGIAEDLAHMNCDVVVEGGFYGEKGLGLAMCCAHVVVIPAGKPRAPGMSRQDLFDTNAKLIVDLAKASISFCPLALLAIITNPVNSMVPVAFEVRRACGRGNPERIFGVTTLDLVRASSFVAKEFGEDPTCVSVPVIGGHAGATIIPLLSQCSPSLTFTDERIAKLTKKIQNAGTEVVKAKAGAGSATLSMAYAAARFVNSLLRGLAGEGNVIDYAYVVTDLKKPTCFATPLLLGQQGVCQILTYEQVSEFEQGLIDKAVPQLENEVKEGMDYVAKSGNLKNKE